jgi:ATP-dependent RNA helicase RhlE
LISLLYQKERTGKFRKSKMLVLSPTRELAQQIGDVTKPYTTVTNLKLSVVVGGVPIFRQFNDLRKGADIIIGTPGRIEDHIEKKSIDLSSIDFVVLDEADQMLDIGFLPSIKRILNLTPKKRQTLLFSATMPAEIKTLIAKFMINPIEVAVSVVSKPIEKIRQKVIMLSDVQKINALEKIVQDSLGARVLVFTRTKRGADKVVKNLSKEGVRIAAIHGNKSQNQRQKALLNFKKGVYPVLIATDIAARGIDVPGVEVVVNFDLPEVPESYVHRIGRTARAGASGDAVSFCSEAQVKNLKEIEKLIKANIRAVNFDGTPFQQIKYKKYGAPGNSQKRKSDDSYPSIKKKRPNNSKNQETAKPNRFKRKLKKKT